jgi:hypothetical protein
MVPTHVQLRLAATVVLIGFNFMGELADVVPPALSGSR